MGTENAHPVAPASGVARKHRDAAAKCPPSFRPFDGNAPRQTFRAPSDRAELDLAQSLADRLRVWRSRAPCPAGNRNGPDVSAQEPGECLGWQRYQFRVDVSHHTGMASSG